MCTLSWLSMAMLGFLPTFWSLSRVLNIHDDPSCQAYSRSQYVLSWYAMWGLSLLSRAIESEVPM